MLRWNDEYIYYLWLRVEEENQLTPIVGHELIYISTAHTHPLAKCDSCWTRDSFIVVGWKCTARIVHDAAVVVAANEGSAGRTFLFKISISCSSIDILPIDSDILVPVPKK